LLGAEMLCNSRWAGPLSPKVVRTIIGASAMAVRVLIAAILLGFQTVSAESIRIGGSGAALPTMKLLGEALKRTTPEFSFILVTDLGTGDGLNALLRDKLEMALSGRPLTKKEEAEGLVALEYARSPFGLVTSKKGVGGLTLAQIADIYAGRRSTWPDGTLIRLVIRNANDVDSALLAAFSPAVRESVALSLARPGLLTAMTDGVIMEDIQRIEGALGALAIAPILAEKRPLYALPIDGVAPSVKNLADGSYPYFKPFYIVTKGSPSASVTRFVDFVHSTEGRRILTETGHWLIPATMRSASPEVRHARKSDALP
jgi:phosphate transport system substrate-binding protein